MKTLTTAMTATNLVIQEQLEALGEKIVELDRGMFPGDDFKGRLNNALIKSYEAQLIIFNCLSECEKIMNEFLKDQDFL